MKKIITSIFFIFLISCSSQNQSQLIKINLNNISPESVIVEAKIVDYEGTKDELKIKPIKILGYGAAAKIINVDENIDLYFQKENFPDVEFKNGKIMILEITSSGEEFLGNMKSKWILKGVLK